jgi:HPt (histidine-containing phosphotransfer) domain-containing protein
MIKPSSSLTSASASAPASKLNVVVVTNCTSTRTAPPKALISSLPSGLTMVEALEAWTSLLNSFEPDTTPVDLYRGVSFNSIVQMLPLLSQGNKAVRIVTGGQGLIDLETKIVGYDFSADRHQPNNIYNVVTKEPFVINWWWSEINKALRASVRPVADLIEDPSVDLVVVGLNKFFMKYIVADILSSAQYPEKLRIITASSSMSTSALGSTKLNQCMIPYGRALDPSTFGNRNDMTHRACLHFLKLLQSNPKMLRQSIEDHRAAVLQSLAPETLSEDGAIAQTTQSAVRTSGDKIREVLKRNPQLLQYSSPDVAHQVARRLYGALGGIIAFRAVWLQMRMQSMKKEVVEGSLSIKPSDKQLDAAKAAMANVASQLKIMNSGSWQEDAQLLEGIQMFVATLREAMPEGHFTTAILADWFKAFYTEAGLPLPKGADNSARLSQLLSASAEELGLERSKVPGSGSFTYSLK